MNLDILMYQLRKSCLATNIRHQANEVMYVILLATNIHHQDNEVILLQRI